MSRGHSLVRPMNTPHAPNKKELGNKWRTGVFSNYIKDYATYISGPTWDPAPTRKVELKLPEILTKIHVTKLTEDQKRYYLAKTCGSNVVAQSTFPKVKLINYDGEAIKYGIDHGDAKYGKADNLPMYYIGEDYFDEYVQSSELSLRWLETGVWIVEGLNPAKEWISLEGTDLFQTVIAVRIAVHYGYEVDNV